MGILRNGSFMLFCRTLSHSSLFFSFLFFSCCFSFFTLRIVRVFVIVMLYYIFVFRVIGIVSFVAFLRMSWLFVFLLWVFVFCLILVISCFLIHMLDIYVTILVDAKMLFLGFTPFELVHVLVLFMLFEVFCFLCRSQCFFCCIYRVYSGFRFISLF